MSKHKKDLRALAIIIAYSLLPAMILAAIYFKEDLDRASPIIMGWGIIAVGLSSSYLFVKYRCW